MNIEWTSILQYAGAGLSICIASLGCGYGEGAIAAKASESIARQPRASGEIVRTMLVTMAVTETPGIFSLLIAVVLLFLVSPDESAISACTYLASGLCIGFGGIGAGIGSGIAGKAACESSGRHPKESNSILLNTLIGQAVVQTGCIFALVISLLMSMVLHSGGGLPAMSAAFGAGLCMGFGAIGSSIGTGIIAEKAIIGISKNSRFSFTITRTMLLGQAIAQTMAILPLIVSFLILLMSGLM